MEDKIQSFINYFLKAGFGGATILILPPLEKDFKNNPKGYRNPKDRNLPYEDVVLVSKDGTRIKGWFLKQFDSKSVPTIVFFHENAGNIGTRLDFLEQYYHSVKANILLVAYRGYSQSEGTPTEEGIQQDAKAIMEHVFSRDDVDKKKIFVHGRSLGGAVTLYTTYEGNQDVAGIILENTFTSISDMVDVLLPKLGFIKQIVLRNYWPSLERIQNIKYPSLFIMSVKDEIVPYNHMMRLYETANKCIYKTKLKIPEGDHNSNWTIDTDKYFRTINDFIQDTLNQIYDI